jgi:hypothetical protein
MEELSAVGGMGGIRKQIMDILLIICYNNRTYRPHQAEDSLQGLTEVVEEFSHGRIVDIEVL